MFICLNCGEVFDENNIGNTTENRGYYGDEKCSAKISCCPICAGEYEEAAQCKICGEYHPKDDLTGGVCEECLDDYRRDFDVCYKISVDARETQKVNINRLIYHLLGVEEINNTLAEYIRTNMNGVDCSEYIEEDEEWFCEKLAKEVNK